MRRGFVLLAATFALGCAARAPRARVILVSIDGLWARDLQRADSAGVRLPTLDSLRRAGELAAGVIGSFPSVTYPSHTTMITGVPPARHGVYANGIFRPPTDTVERSYHERSAIQVPTVFDAARAAGLKVAAIFWPVTAHDSSIDYDIPDAWDQTGRRSQLAALRFLGTPWLLDSLRAPNEGEPSDSLRVDWAERIVRRWNPDLLALHVLELDGAKHDFGIWNDSVIRVLRTLDRQLSSLLTTVRTTEAGRQTTLMVTSDHGFLGYRRQLRPGVLLTNAGLVTADSTGRVVSWDAGVHANGGSAVFLPRDSTDPSIAARIRAAIPDSLVGPGSPIRAVIPRDTIALLGGDPRALWALDMNEGFYSIAGYTGPFLRERTGGGHGYDQRRPELHAFFLISGPGIPRGTTRPLMRQTEIAEIVARILGLRGF
jgi:arylsulfatase A-like enzyme